MLQGKNSSFEGPPPQHRYMDQETVDGKHLRYFLLDQRHSKFQKKNMVRVITTTYLNIHYFQDINVSKVHPLIKNLFRIKSKHASLHQQGD